MLLPLCNAPLDDLVQIDAQCISIEVFPSIPADPEPGYRFRWGSKTSAKRSAWCRSLHVSKPSKIALVSGAIRVPACGLYFSTWLSIFV